MANRSRFDLIRRVIHKNMARRAFGIRRLTTFNHVLPHPPLAGAQAKAIGGDCVEPFHNVSYPFERSPR
jgi:hypothetical protein